MFETHVDTDELVESLGLARSTVVTPLMFEYELMDRARSDRRRIVLPEGDDDRVLRAAATVLARGIADLTILGEEIEVRAPRPRARHRHLSAAEVLSPFDAVHVDRFAREYERLRAHKGVTYAQAADTVTDVSYFGTLMVHLGLADGMVSGAAHTTAHTIRPAFEIIKTKPGVSVVSSVFLMALADRVLVYGDCAVIPDPTAAQLADIAISSAATAAQFGIDPRVAMLSYSTGESGSGADVEKVREATALVRERAPELLVEGPIQYDAAADAAVAKAKMPGFRRGRARDGVRLPRPQHRQQHLQGGAALGRRGRDRPGAAGSQQADQRPVARRARGRHRQHHRDHRDPGAGRADSEAAA